MSFVDTIASVLKIVLKNELTRDLTDLLKSFSVKRELECEDYMKLADALEKAARKTEDPSQEASLQELIKLWRERARTAAYDQLYAIREEANTRLNLGQVEIAETSFEKAADLGKKIEDQTTASYIADSIARNYLDKTDYTNAIPWFEKAVGANPQNYDALLGLSYALGMVNRIQDALEVSERATKVYENGAEGWHSKGFYLMALDRNQEALEAFKKGIAANRTYWPIYYAKAKLLMKMQEFAKSISCYDEYLNLQPNSADVWNEKGIVYYENLGKNEEAEKCYKKALEINPKHVQALYNIGLVKMRIGKPSLALKFFDEALSIDPSYTNALYEKGRVHEQMGNFEEAVVTYRKVATLEPNAEDAWMGLGYVLFMLGRYQEAYDAYDHATNIATDNELSWYSKAVSLERLERDEEAIGCYRRVINLNPQYSKALQNLAQLLEHLGKYEEATQCIDKLIDIDPKDPYLWNWKGNIYYSYLKQYQKAAEYYNKAIQADPGYKYAWYNIGNCNSELGNRDEAIKAYTTATKIDSKYRDAWYWKGREEQASGRFREALESYKNCVNLNSEDIDAWFGLGYVQNELGNHADAIASYTKALKLDESDVASWANKGYGYMKLGKLKHALKCFDKALEIDPNYEYALLQKTRVLEEIGNEEDSIKTITKLLDLNPENSEALTEKALILINRREYKGAEKALEEALKYNPENATAWVAKGMIFCDFLKKAEEAYKCFLTAHKIEPARIDAAASLAEVAMITDRYNEARRTALETLKMEPNPDTECVMYFLVFATLLIENRENEAQTEMQRLLQFYSIHFKRKKVDWNFEGNRHFLNSSKSKYKGLMLKTLDLFETKTSLAEFQEEAKGLFQSK